VQKGASEYNDFSGIIATVYAVASEQADLRSWNMLPSSIQVARIAAPAHLGAEILEKNAELPPFREITNGRYILLFATSLNNRIFSFPPIESIDKELPADVQVQSVAGESGEQPENLH
jgi:hypothetical protein